MDRTDLAVGEDERSVSGSAIVTSLAFAVVFVLFTWISKETRSLNLHQPWRDDPYDVLVSLDFVVLPVLVVTAALRVQLCRRFLSLPARRLVDLLRICGVAVGVCLATELGEWVAVASGPHGAAQTAATTWQVAALAVLTLATAGALLLLRRAANGIGRVATPAAQPDWIADAMTLALCVTQPFGRHRDRARSAVRWIDVQVTSRVRRHSIAAAAVVACVLALPYAAIKLVLEGYPPALLLLSFALPATSLFAFIVVAGLFLRIVAPEGAVPPAWLCALVTACVAGDVCVAFHDALLTRATPAGLDALLFGGGVVGGMAGLVALAAFRHLRPGSWWG